MSEQIKCDRGHRGRKVMPASEACMHMKVTDKPMDFEVTEHGGVQLFVTDDETPAFSQHFSSTITIGEAGLYYNDQGPEEYFYRAA
jgi:hypothetical protein